MFVLVNALHAKTGGGLVYLNHILPLLAQVKDMRLAVVAHAAHADKLALSPQVELWTVDIPDNFALIHLWEQWVLPFKARAAGVEVTLCNANYVPFLAPRPVPIIHNNPDVLRFARSRKEKLYWHAIIWLTRLSLWRAPLALSVAAHVVPTFTRGIWRNLARKVRVAPPACGGTPSGKPSVEVNRHTLLTVGDVYVQKGYDVLIHVLAQVREKIPDARLLVVGRPVDATLTENLKRLAEGLNVADALTFTGAMPHEDLLKLYPSCGVYVSTGWVECFNMPVLEAMGGGAPVVVADSPFQREVAGEAARYVPSAADPAPAFAEAIVDVLKNQQKAEELRQRGRERATAFSWHKTAEIIEQVLKEAGTS